MTHITLIIVLALKMDTTAFALRLHNLSNWMVQLQADTVVIKSLSCHATFMMCIS